MLQVRSCAKVNLTLDVLSRRSDGYHELQSIVHTVGLWDTISLQPDSKLSLSCNIDALETDDNLCLKAARLWFEAATEFKSQIGGVRIALDKQIPFGAGLGGGSGNAAAILIALNQLYEVAMPDKVLWKLASQLGADVPFFLKGGCALMEGIGEKLTPLPPIPGWLVLVQPPQTLSTPQIYRRWDALDIASAQRTSQLQSTLMEAANDLTAIGANLHNDLRQAAQAEGVDVAALIEMLKRSDALGAEMTGSGSAVFGLFEREQTAREVAGQVRCEANATNGSNPKWRVWVAPFCRQGVEVQSVS